MKTDNSLSALGNDQAIYKSFSQLSAINRLKVGWAVFRLQSQIIFSRMFAWFMAAILGYFTILYIVNYRQPIIERLDQEDILFALLVLPLTILSLYLNIQLIVSEKEKRTLEVLFTTAGSRYKVWILRVTTLNVLLLIITFGLTSIAFFTIADVTIVGTALNGFVPPLFLGSVALYFSVRLRSALAAWMASIIAIFLIMVFSDILEDTRYFLFFNAYDVPRGLDPQTWNLWMWQNRIGFFVLAILLQFFALRGLENRERMLR